MASDKRYSLRHKSVTVIWGLKVMVRKAVSGLRETRAAYTNTA